MKSLHLLYHELRPEPSRYSYVIPCAEFEEHCRLYRNLRDGSGSEEGAAEIFRPEVTFDDGHSSDIEYALPRLRAAGLHAHFFITAGWTGQRTGYMNGAQLRTLHQAGMTVGAHGWSHKLLTACTDAELNVELGDARSRLQDTLGCLVETMSLPGGRANERVLRACRAAGYTTVFTSEPRATSTAAVESGSTVGRLNLRSGLTTAWLEQMLHPGTGALIRQQRADRLKGVAKAVLGDRLYAAAWGLANRHEAETDQGTDSGAPA